MKRQLLYILFLLLMVTQNAWAWDTPGLSGGGSSSNPYLIQSASDWEILVNYVDDDTSIGGYYYRQTADISVTTMVGSISESKPFVGTYDGGGHTLTINYNNTTDYTAPFRYIQGATFKNLKVTGNITTTRNLAAGIAGLNTGAAATFDRCVTDVTINSSSTTEVGWGCRDYHGGFLAHTINADVSITDCVCGGSVNRTSSGSSNCASFVGVAENCTVHATRCLSTISYTNVNKWNSLSHCADDAYRAVDVFYYVNANDAANVGTKVTTSQLADGTITTALQGGHAESVWAQDPITNQPMLKLFANDGKLPGEFSVNPTKQVRFSQGNLQYQASTNRWRIAEHQYDYVGDDNANISSTYSGWIDLFGWGTSGNSASGTNYQPWSTSTTGTQYGPSISSGEWIAENSDWGVVNANQLGPDWCVLTNAEWGYLFNTRTTTATINATPNARYTLSRINTDGSSVYGIILFPDDFDGTASYSGVTWGTINAPSYGSTTCTTAGWSALEEAGCVFLPATGYRNDLSMMHVGTNCHYWSSTAQGTSNAYNLDVNFNVSESVVYPQQNYSRHYGFCVRLVYETPFLGSGTLSDPYLISSEADWNLLADKVSTGYTYSGEFFRQTADINVTTMVGINESKSFQGTFNGDGHTLTITKGSSESAFNEESCAPFRHVKNATITNLQVAGTIYTSAMRASGLVATSHGALTLAGCRSSVNINSSKSGDGTHGGLVAITTGSGNNITIDGCVFDGSFATTSSTNSCGGFVGWTGQNTPAITNSLMKPGCVAAGMLNNTFARWQTGYEPTITNCYYVATDNLPTDQGKLARSISADTDVTISNLGAASATYNVSGITAYTHGIKYGSTFYAGNGDEVSLTLSHGDKEGFTFNRYTVTGGGTLDNETSNTPTLTMTDADQEINAQWIGVNPNWSYSSSGNVLSAYGEGGYTEEDPLSITISAPADLQFDGKYKPATISNTAAWQAAGLTVPTILYNGKINAPSLLGDYTASISADEATAEISYTIKSVINYQSFFDGGLTRGKNFDVIASTGAYEVELNNAENKGVYWNSDENCAVFDGEAYLQIDNPLGNVTAETGLTLTMDVYISSENNGTGQFYRSTGAYVDKNGWQRLFELSDGNPEDCIFINAGNANNGTAHLMWCLRKGYEVNKLEVWNNIPNSYFDQWSTITLVVAPGGYTTLYVNGEVLTHSSSEDVSKITNVLNYISSYDKCYIGTSIFEVTGSNADGFFIGKIRGFQTAEGALMPYFDGTNYHYLLSYATNGGNPITGTFEATIPANLPTPTHPDAGAVFLGWYMDEALTIPVTTGVALTKNTALYAKWINPSDYKLPGAFSISDAKRVCFSQGNLKYQASTDTWQFAEHQYNYIGNAAGNTAPSASQTAWIDLFGWATLGYNEKYPYMTSVTNSDYSTGVSVGNDFDSNYDWGTQAADNIGNGWRILTHAEWTYLFNTRTTSTTVNSTPNARYTMATINTDGTSVNGVILFPDNFDGSASYSGVTWGIINGTSDWGYGTSCTTAGWTALQNAGCVFLPAAGYREGTTVGETGTQGGYWSSTASTDEASYALRFVSNTLESDFSCHWKYGYSVRLVSETPFIGLGIEENPYLISSEADWNNLANQVSAGNTYNNKYFQQTADIGTSQSPITSMVGIYSNNISERRPFSGNFDGNGHTLTVNYSSNNNETRTAPFSYVNVATIRNLIVTGNCGTPERSAGIVGESDESNGPNTITNCVSSVTISGGPCVGGISIGGNVNIEGCLFNGTINGSSQSGGFVGWGQNVTKITNSVFAPQAESSINGCTFYYTGSDNGGATVTNSYYMTLLGDAQGKYARTITTDNDDITISGLGAASATYDVSDITAYAHGIKYGGTYYAGNGDEVSLTLSHDKSGFSFIQYTVTGGGTLTNPTTDTPTLTMTNDNQVISATWKKLLSNTDITIADIPSQTYDGTALTPVITVTDGTTPLTQGTDYTVSPETATNTGEYEVTITGIGNYDGTATKTFTIVPQVTNYGAATITWDQTGKTATLDGVSDLPCNITVETNVNHAVLNRTFTSGKKVTICLPFVVTAEQAATLGTFYYFSGVTGEGQIEMTQVTSDLTAHTPYIFEPSSGRTTFDFGEKTILTGSPLTTSFNGLEFKGIYDRVKWTANDQDALYNADRAAELGKAYGFALQNMTVGTKTYEVGQFVKLGDGAHSRAFRAYLLYDGTWDGNQPTNPASSAPRRSDVTLPDVIEIVWKDADGNVTGISALDTRSGEMADYGTDWYTVDGRKLDGKPATKGLYINNGRKVVVK